ncbi:beta-lactamase/transpeptidase-like protein, partial [Hyaloraphidium curvatum]
MTNPAYPPLSVFSESPPISGFVAPGFETVLEEFKAHFQPNLRELGSSFCAFHRGKPVVLLFGGHADEAKTRKFDGDTLTCVFSSGKSVMSTVTVSQISAGRFGWNDRIASIWPEFAAGGKADVTVKDMLNLPFSPSSLPPPLPPLLSPLPGRIAGNPHNFKGKLKKAYHAVTRGWFLNEIVCRRHPKGLSHGRILREEIMPRIGAEIYAGLPRELHHRVSPVVHSEFLMAAQALVAPSDSSSENGGNALALTITGLTDVPANRTTRNTANSPAVMECETPSAYTITNAWSLAALGSVLSRRG